MEAVTARLEQHAAQIQNVSDQLEASKPAPQVVKNPKNRISNEAVSISRG
jgi:hypothetical protein